MEARGDTDVQIVRCTREKAEDQPNHLTAGSFAVSLRRAEVEQLHQAKRMINMYSIVCVCVFFRLVRT